MEAQIAEIEAANHIVTECENRKRCWVQKGRVGSQAGAVSIIACRSRHYADTKGSHPVRNAG
jgi:hypothetical protein